MNPIQSVFHPGSRDAAAITELMWILVVGLGVVFLVTMALAALALRSPPAWLGRQQSVVAAGIVLPTVVVLGLLVHTLRLVGARADVALAVRVEITGHQWWWQIRYLTQDERIDFETANELRLPAGRPVEVTLVSADVLHSFWVPGLAGKLDLVPGRVNRMRISAERPGVFRGQCAEYCGGPHAQMALYVVAETDDEFESWRERQRQPAPGAQSLFLSRCAVCHTVRGTPAEGKRGPDLTHVGSRVSLAAGILPNNAHTLADWIASSQHIKPGNLMPSFGMLSGEELRALGQYLESLR